MYLFWEYKKVIGKSLIYQNWIPRIIKGTIW